MVVTEMPKQITIPLSIYITNTYLILVTEMPGKGGIPWNKGISKYPLLMDREALYQKYWVEGLTEDKIGEGIGCCGRHVGFWMQKFNIPHRDMSEYFKGKTKYKKLEDEKWLYQKYIVEKQSSCKIADIVGCSPGTVFLALNRFGIKGRTLSETRNTVRFPTTYTTIECIYWNISKKNNIPSEYTGNGSFRVGRVNPDFIIKDKRVAIFINGDYWHSALLRPNLKYTNRPENQIAECKRHKWKAAIIWEADLRREDAEAFVLSVLKKEGVI